MQGTELPQMSLVQFFDQLKHSVDCSNIPKIKGHGDHHYRPRQQVLEAIAGLRAEAAQSELPSLFAQHFRVMAWKMIVRESVEYGVFFPFAGNTSLRSKVRLFIYGRK